ncbi:MAG: class II glutamine amidotransferase [Sphingomonadales bacterium]|nr:class II glutamine amidotransferase [Sphingomonadales bacterium]MBD3772658.1 class II glutamine amidotransferase [Paracoccaceae bacterium]
MCELFAVSAARPSVLHYELNRFAREGGERHRNRDGWGIAFAEERDSHLFREAEPAADSELAKMVMARAIPSRTVLAHVRRASRGARLIANTHPFTRVREGRAQHFAHNGTLHGIESLPEAVALARQRVGDTDSELAFLLLLARMGRSGGGIDKRFDIFSTFCADMRALGSANFLFYDGDVLFAHADRRQYETERGLTEPREPGLVIRRFETEGECLDGWHATGAHIPEVHPGTVLLASVPLNDSGWHDLPRGATLALRDGSILASCGM